MEPREKYARKIKISSYVEDNTAEESESSVASEPMVTEDICVICGEFGKNRELWVRCIMCAGWAHQACTDSENLEWICDFCQ